MSRLQLRHKGRTEFDRWTEALRPFVWACRRDMKLDPDDHGADMEGALIDTLANIMHFCDAEPDLDFEMLLLTARAQFQTEDLAQERRTQRHHQQP